MLSSRAKPAPRDAGDGLGHVAPGGQHAQGHSRSFLKGSISLCSVFLHAFITDPCGQRRGCQQAHAHGKPFAAPRRCLPPTAAPPPRRSRWRPCCCRPKGQRPGPRSPCGRFEHLLKGAVARPAAAAGQAAARPRPRPAPRHSSSPGPAPSTSATARPGPVRRASLAEQRPAARPVRFSARFKRPYHCSEIPPPPSGLAKKHRKGVFDLGQHRAAQHKRQKGPVAQKHLSGRSPVLSRPAYPAARLRSPAVPAAAARSLKGEGHGKKRQPRYPSGAPAEQKPHRHQPLHRPRRCSRPPPGAPCSVPASRHRYATSHPESR